MSSEAGDPHASGSNVPSDSEPAWAQTKSGNRILELSEVEENVARLLHFAGCTLASLHPDPLSSFTPRTVEPDDEDDDDDAPKPPNPAAPDPEDTEAKGVEFAKYAEAYYTTLNEIQLSLRTSIRHLRLSRASPAPILDPSFASLANPGGGGIGVGGVALGEGEGGSRMSVAAMKLEQEAWKDLGQALGKGEG